MTFGLQVLFLIPRNPPPTLDDKFSKPFREFVALCLQRDPRAVSRRHSSHCPAFGMLTIESNSAAVGKRIAEAPFRTECQAFAVSNRAHRETREFQVTGGSESTCFTEPGRTNVSHSSFP